MPGTKKSYVNSITGAVRKSSTAMGFPYVEMSAANAKKAGAQATAKANKATSTSTEGAKPGTSTDSQGS